MGRSAPYFARNSFITRVWHNWSSRKNKNYGRGESGGRPWGASSFAFHTDVTICAKSGWELFARESVPLERDFPICHPIDKQDGLLLTHQVSAAC